MKTKFYYCPKCGNVIIKAIDSGVTPVCCGEEMVELNPNKVEAKTEYHLPVSILLNPCTLKVKVGAEPHPMTKEHSIRFIYVETSNTGHIVHFHPGHPAEATINIGEAPTAIYAYCNLHGLWKTELSAGPECKKHLYHDSDSMSCEAKPSGNE